MTKLMDLRTALGRATDELNGLIDDPAAFDLKETEIKNLEKTIERAEFAQARSASLAKPAVVDEAPSIVPKQEPFVLEPYFEESLIGRGQVKRVPPFEHFLRKARAQLREQNVPFTPEGKAPFANLGEMLKAVANYYMSRGTVMDNRLVRAPTGAGEIDPSAGGFMVQTDFSTAVFMRAYTMGEILARIQKLSLSTSANSIKIPAVDEQSRVTGSRWGGVQSYWVGEGMSVTATKPKFRLIELDLKKLMSVMYVTDELLADTSVLTALAGQAFSEEIMFMTEDAIFEGTGSGQPLGISNAQALVVVPKEVGQQTKTIVYENVLKMWSRMWNRSRANAVWWINQDNEPQLLSMSQIIGTGGVPVYLPANGISGQPYGTLFGRPVIPVEYAQTLGTQGDITLADYSQYCVVDKGGVQAASSMHVAFLTDEMVFRITYRVDGQPIWHTALTPFHGVNTLSPFVQLGSR